ncbi:hypothetical protein JCM1840_007396 [Sporobolomyces johnsonii]
MLGLAGLHPGDLSSPLVFVRINPGLYKNLRDETVKRSFTVKNLPLLVMGERAVMAYPLLTIGAVLLGLLAFEQGLGCEVNLPPVSLAGTSTTGSATRNYQSFTHVKPEGDTEFTYGACFSSPTPPPRGTTSFTLPAIDNGWGIAFENGEGVVMAFQGVRNVHTQANPLPSTNIPRPLEHALPSQLEGRGGDQGMGTHLSEVRKDQ